MSLDVCLVKDDDEKLLFWGNITHNLSKMASMADLRYPLWEPENYHYGPLTKANQLIPVLRIGLEKLKNNPDYFELFTPENGWGSCDGLVAFVEMYLEACIKYPDASVCVSR